MLGRSSGAACHFVVGPLISLLVPRIQSTQYPHYSDCSVNWFRLSRKVPQSGNLDARFGGWALGLLFHHWHRSCLFGCDTSLLAADCLTDRRLFIVTLFHVQSTNLGIPRVSIAFFLGLSFSIYIYIGHRFGDDRLSERKRNWVCKSVLELFAYWYIPDTFRYII